MSLTQFCNYMGVSKNTAKEYLRDIEVVAGRLYHIPEIADELIDRSALREGRCNYGK